MKTAAQRTASGLGLLSGALGVAALTAPARLIRLIGLRETPTVRRAVRAVGVQELGAAAGVLGSGRPATALWGRVAGDVTHLALLTTALGRGDVRRRRTAGALAAVAAIAAADAASARLLTESTSGRVTVRTAITINRPRDEVYRAWRDLERLPTFMSHLRSVEEHGDGRSTWVADAPGLGTVEWQAELVTDQPGERLSWRTVDGAAVGHSGTVRFSDAPGDRGTEVAVELEHPSVAGGIGTTVAKLFGEEPQQQVRDDLRRLKQVLEAGEVVRSDGSPLGTRSQNQWHQDDAQPKEAQA